MREDLRKVPPREIKEIVIDSTWIGGTAVFTAPREWVGTVAVICASEFTVKLVALTPPKVTLVVPVKLWPVIVTIVPTGPLGGEKPVITGTTLKTVLLESVPLGVVT